MKKRVYLVSLIIVLLIGVVFCFVKKENLEKEKYIVDNNKLAMYLQESIGSGTYVLSNTKVFPNEGYILNSILSKCENGSKLKYDAETRKIMLDANMSDVCYVYFDVYIQPKYWDDFNGSYLFPNTPTETYTSPTKFPNQFYIKTTATEHNACIYYNSKEFCLKVNYWVSGDTDGSTTKTKLQNEMASTLGVDSSSLSCNTFSYSDNTAYCNISNLTCTARSNGNVSCGNGQECVVTSDGTAYCYE